MSNNIIRTEKNTNFVVMDKRFLNNKNLSWKAKGIMSYMLSKPDDWTFYIDELIKHSTDGKSSFRSGFNELKKEGYIQRRKRRKENGTFEWETILTESPHTDFPQVDNPSMEKPQMDNRTLLSNEELNNDELSNDKEYIYSIFNYWNEKNIMKHRKTNGTMRSNINGRLGEYSEEEIKKAIDNYNEVLCGNDYFWTHKWSLQDFMKPNNLVKFVDESKPLENYKKNQKKPRKVVNLDDFDLDD